MSTSIRNPQSAIRNSPPAIRNSPRIHWRIRPDLAVSQQTLDGQTWWLVKDPLSLEYYRLANEEYAVLAALDGRTHADELTADLADRFPHSRWTVSELEQLVAQFEQHNLLVCDTPGHAGRLERRSRERKVRNRLAAGLNPLSTRLASIDPEPLLRRLYPLLAWMFRPWCIVLTLLLVAAAAGLIVVQFESFRTRLPGLGEFFAGENLAWLLAVILCTKLIHELGHALWARHFGGECHELGVMLLVGMPCLYCNTSDSWMQPGKWRRAAVAAAGMYAELVLAAAATFLWWFSQPGLLNSLCLNVIFVCGTGTLLFNANPLLRYDGYYILSDLLEIPNLRARASQALKQVLSRWCLGVQAADDPFAPRRRAGLFALYAVASSLYRWLVTFSILWFLCQVLKPYGLELLGRMLAGLMLYAMLVVPCWKLLRLLASVRKGGSVNRLRLSVTLCGLAAVAAAVGFCPLPHRVACHLVVEPRDAAHVYVEVPGRIERVLVRPGQRVEAGQPLAELSNLDLELQVAELTAALAQRTGERDDLHRQRFVDKSAALRMGEVEAEIADLQQRLAERRSDAAKLVLRAPAAGHVLPPPALAQRAQTRQLASWGGSPLDEQNLGATLQPGTLLCQIGDPAALEAVLIIDQQDIERVRPGQPVTLQVSASSARAIESRIEEVAQRDLAYAPRQLSARTGGRLATHVDAAGHERPLTASYQARVLFADPAGQARAGLSGRARIHAGTQTLLQWAWRNVANTFHFRL